MELETNWWSCDGTGGRATEGAPEKEFGQTGVQAQVSRRGVLMTLGLGALAWAMPRTALSQVSVGREREGNVLVSVFLRGGLDGLNAVVPYADDGYHRARPSLALKAPGSSSRDIRTLDLDGFFGLNPAMASLLPLYREGRMAIVHAVGSQDHTRSHFEAMAAMERGLSGQQDEAANGWLARHLAACPAGKSSPLRAVSFGTVMPDSLRGAPSAVSVQSLADFRLESKDEARLRQALGSLYAEGKDAMSVAGRETLEVLATLSKLSPDKAQPENGSKYPDSGLGKGLRQVAFLARANVGLEVACLDMGGWDTHVAQGVTAGWLPGLLKDLADSLAAFDKDLGPERSRVTVVVQTEFGRRVAENAGLGTDHGRGSCMFLLGGGVLGGKVVGRWPGLASEVLEGPGDLPVTTDYRDPLCEVLTRRTPATDLASVFPGHRQTSLGLIS